MKLKFSVFAKKVLSIFLTLVIFTGLLPFTVYGGTNQTVNIAFSGVNITELEGYYNPYYLEISFSHSDTSGLKRGDITVYSLGGNLTLADNIINKNGLYYVEILSVENEGYIMLSIPSFTSEDGFIQYNVSNSMLDIYIPNLQIPEKPDVTETYRINTPAECYLNGITASIEFDKTLAVPGESVTAAVRFSGTAEKSGIFRAEVLSANVNFSPELHEISVVARQEVSDVLTLTFIMPACDLDDIICTVSFDVGKSVPEEELLTYNLTPVSYNGGARQLEVYSGADGLGEITVKYNGELTPPINAGTYVISVHIAESENYESAEFVLGMWTIEKAFPSKYVLDYDRLFTTAVYDGKIKEFSVMVSQGINGLGNITVKYNNIAQVPSGAGIYTISVFVEEGLNYKSAEIILGEWIIEKSDLNESMLFYDRNFTSIIYNGVPERFEVSLSPEIEGYGEVTVMYNGSVAQPNGAGAYTISVHVGEGTNYKAADFSLGIWMIEKADLEEVMLIYDKNFTPVMYDGIPKIFAVSVSPELSGRFIITIKYNNMDIPPTDAGEYLISVYIEGNENYQSKEIILGTWIIEKAVFNSRVLVYDDSFPPEVYDGLPKTFQVAPANGITGLGDLTIKYNGNETLPVNAGTYTVTVSAGEGTNFTGGEIILGEWTVNKAVPTKDMLVYDTSFTPATYDGTPKEFSVTALPDIEGFGAVSVNYNGSEMPPSSAGTYLIGASVAESFNFSAMRLIPLGEWKIEKAVPVKEMLIYDIDFAPVVYDGLPKEFAVIVSAEIEGMGDFCVKYNGSETLPVNAGVYDITVSIDSGDNYEEAEINLGRWTIEKASSGLTALPYEIFVDADESGRINLNAILELDKNNAYINNPLFAFSYTNAESFVFDVEQEPPSIFGTYLYYKIKTDASGSETIIINVTTDNYTGIPFEITFSVNGDDEKVVLTVTGLSVTEKIYDGTVTATITGSPVLNGMIPEKSNVRLNTDNAHAEFYTKNACNNITVTVSGVYLEGKDKDLYELSSIILQGDILPLNVDLLCTADDKTYDGTAYAEVRAELTGVISGDDVRLEAGTSAFNDINAGENKKISLDGYVLTGLDARNYILDIPGIFANIYKADALVTGTYQIETAKTGEVLNMSELLTVTGIGGNRLEGIWNATAPSTPGENIGITAVFVINDSNIRKNYNNITAEIKLLSVKGSSDGGNTDEENFGGENPGGGNHGGGIIIYPPNETEENTFDGILLINGEDIPYTISEDGTVVLYIPAENIIRTVSTEDNEGDTIYTVDVRHLKNIEVNLPSAVLSGSALNIITEIGSVIIPNTVLKNFAEIYGGNITVSIKYGSFSIEILSNGGLVKYNDLGDSLVISIPLYVESGKNVSYYVAVRKETSGNIICPSSVYKDGWITFFADRGGRYDIIYNDPELYGIDAHWAYDYVMTAASRGLFGDFNGEVNADEKVTLLEFAEMLARMDGKSAASAYNWVINNLIIDASALQNEYLTRAQMAVMLNNFIIYKGYSLNLYETDVFSDSGLMSDATAEAALNLKQAGIINGKGNNLFDPYAITTKAEVATVLIRLINACAENYFNTCTGS